MRKRSPDTPYLAIDKNLLAKNIERMAKKTSEAGINLRPHVKTHKIPEIARLPKVGYLIRVSPNHVCNAVNLVDRVHLLESQKVVGSWKVAARGRNS